MADAMEGAERNGSAPRAEVATLFLKLGVISFGGPAAHVALMRAEVVRRHRWVSDEQFLDLLGASNLIPGPTATELAIYLGYVRSGWRSLILRGALFVLPARQLPRWWSTGGKALVLMSLGTPALLAQSAGTPSPCGLGALFLSFLKIGSVIYGSG